MRATLGVVPVASLLTDHSARLEDVDLTARFVVNGLAHRTDRVHVLDLTTCAERLASATDRDVHVDSHRALFHLRVARADGEQDAAQFGDVLTCLIGVADVGLGDDLDERDTRAVEIDERVVAAMDAATRAPEVRRLAGVFLEVCAFDADLHVTRQHEVSVHIDRLVVLRDLVRLRQVGIEVVLAVERARLHRAIERQSETDRKFDCASVQHRQRTG